MMASSDDGSWAETATPAQAKADDEGVGDDLRRARERLGWSLPAISAHLRIRLPFLQAIEEGRTADLPGNAYAVGFIRTYALALGLDPAEIARRFRTEAGEVNRKTELDFPAPVPDRGVPALAVVLVGAVIAVGAYVGWYWMSGNDRPSANVVQQVPDRLAPLVPEKPPAAPSIVPAAPPVADPATLAAAGQRAPASVSPSSAAAATARPMPSPAITPAGQSPSAESRIVVRATSDAWVQVRDRGGQMLLNRVLRAGETWPAPPKSNLLLTTGNAGGTEVVVDGTPAPALGAEGTIRRDLPLDADALKARVAVSAPGAYRPTVSPRNQ